MKTWAKLKALLRRRKAEAEMSEEIALHLELQTEQNVAAGMAPDEARHAAQRMFGGVEQVKERCRDQRRWVGLELCWKELGFAVRSLRRARGFSLAVIATLALCLGPNTAILSVLYTLVLKPLPFHEPERLVSISNIAERQGGAKRPSSVVQCLDFRTRADKFEGFGYFTATNATIGEDDAPVRVAGMQVSANLFALLGIRTQLGRGFTPDEEPLGAERVVILSDLAWRTRHHADPGIVGRQVQMDAQSFTVVGVAARSFEDLFNDVEFFRPYQIPPQQLDPQTRYQSNVRLIGRLKPSVTLDEARAQLEVIEQAFRENVASPPLHATLSANGYRIGIEDARKELAEPVRTPLFLLQGGAACVLLIGCVNVVSLLLARTSAKRPELAIRQALGAGGMTLLRQMLAESLLLAGLAGAAGMAIALGMLRVVNHYLPTVVRHIPPIALDPQVYGVVGAVVVALVLGMSIAPFVLLRHAGLRPGETPNATTGRAGRRAIGGLVIAQVALALVLLIGAGLLIRSFARVMAVRPGFDADRIVSGRVYLPLARYQEPRTNIAVQGRTLTAMREIAGAESVALSADVPISATFRPVPFMLREQASGTSGAASALVCFNRVSPEFFATMGIRLREGRGLREDDDMRTNPVAVVDESFAARFFPGGNAVGQEFVLGTTPPESGRPWMRIVGVVSRANLGGLEARDSWPFVYVPFNQQPTTAFSVLVRSPRLTADVVAEMRARLRSIDPTLPLYGPTTLAVALDTMLGNRRALMWLLGVFAALALALAALGLYGVLNYDVTQRTREIGIRGAVGASRGQIVLMILRQGLLRAALGLAAGLAGAFLFARMLRKMLFDVTPTDPFAYGGVALLLLVVALLASWLPARRAAKVDPIVALRTE